MSFHVPPEFFPKSDISFSFQHVSSSQAHGRLHTLKQLSSGLCHGVTWGSRHVTKSCGFSDTMEAVTVSQSHELLTSPSSWLILRRDNACTAKALRSPIKVVIDDGKGASTTTTTAPLQFPLYYSTQQNGELLGPVYLCTVQWQAVDDVTWSALNQSKQSNKTRRALLYCIRLQIPTLSLKDRLLEPFRLL